MDVGSTVRPSERTNFGLFKCASLYKFYVIVRGGYLILHAENLRDRKTVAQSLRPTNVNMQELIT